MSGENVAEKGAESDGPRWHVMPLTLEAFDDAGLVLIAADVVEAHARGAAGDYHTLVAFTVADAERLRRIADRLDYEGALARERETVRRLRELLDAAHESERELRQRWWAAVPPSEASA